MRSFYWLLPVFLLLQNCKSKKDSQPSGQTGLPNTPVEVVKKWQEAQDSRQFDVARNLSTERARKFIDLGAQLMSDPEMADAALPVTALQGLSCRMKNDTCAVCTFFTEEDGERLNDSLLLLKIKGQWLVDLPDDDVHGDLNDGEPSELLFPEDSIEQ